MLPPAAKPVCACVVVKVILTSCCFHFSHIALVHVLNKILFQNTSVVQLLQLVTRVGWGYFLSPPAELEGKSCHHPHTLLPCQKHNVR